MVSPKKDSPKLKMDTASMKAPATVMTPLLPPPIERPTRKAGNKLWMVVSIVAGLSATALLLLSLRKGQRENSMSLWSVTNFSKNSEKKSTTYYSGVKYTSMTYTQKAELFSQFKTDYKREYTTTEVTTRLAYFLAFLETVDERNEKEAAAGGTAVHGITMFSDMSPDEFKAYRGANAAMKGGVAGSEIALEAVVEEVDSKVLVGDPCVALPLLSSHFLRLPSYHLEFLGRGKTRISLWTGRASTRALACATRATAAPAGCV